MLGAGGRRATGSTLVPATLAKGLEFDQVVVVEPADIVAAEPSRGQGLRRLYVVLTRAVSGLTVVHARPLPAELGETAACMRHLAEAWLRTAARVGCPRRRGGQRRHLLGRYAEPRPRTITT